MSRIFFGLVLLFLFSVPIPGLNFLHKISFALDRSVQIRGRVIDADSKASIEFATVSLNHFPDTIPALMTATDLKGEFGFENIQSGNYIISVRFMGFKEYKSVLIKVTGQESIHRLEPISIHPDNISIDEITIRANSGKPVYQLDKKIIYVENQLSSSGGSASDILNKLPSVTQSPDGKIAIHGNSNFLVYINGKPSSLKGDELLQNTSAAEIKKIELITSPSAKYDASGSGGIINLITKKSVRDGLNGSIMVAGDNLGGYSSDLLLNYKYKNFSFFGGLDQNRRRNEGNISYLTDYLTDNTLFSKSGLQKAQRTNTGLRTGFDYIPSTVNKISVSGNAGKFETNNNGDWMTYKGSLQQSKVNPNKVTDDNNRQGWYGGADVTFEHKFKTENRILSLSILWNTANYDDHYLNRVNDQAGTEQMNQITNLNKKQNNFQFNTDYSTPTGETANLELGYQLTLNRENETYLSELNQYQPITLAMTKQESNLNGLIQAGYGTWQYKMNRLNLKIGLRGEYLNRELKTTDNRYPLVRFDLYPTFNSSFRIDSIQEILFNYTRRTDQLKTIHLDPLPRWYDFYNVSVGNPDLKNEITDKIALDYLVNLKNLTMVSELYFYNTVDKVEVIRSIYQNEIIRNRYENMGSEKTFGLEFNGNWSPCSSFSINEKLDLINSSLDVRLDQVAQKKNYSQWYSVTTANFKITPTTTLEADFSYYGPALTAQSKIDQVYMAGISFRQQLFNKKLIFTITGRDFLGIYKKVEHIQGADFTQEFTSKNKFPIRFSLSYKLNQFKRDERRLAKTPQID